MHDLQVGDIAFLVWADWSTGDSFGHGDRSNVESFGLFKNEADAYALQDALEHAKEDANNPSWDARHKFTWTSSEGQVVESGFLPWFGYFESLDNVYVERVIIGE
jgi:hypothetical protein